MELVIIKENGGKRNSVIQRTKTGINQKEDNRGLGAHIMGQDDRRKELEENSSQGRTQKETEIPRIKTKQTPRKSSKTKTTKIEESKRKKRRSVIRDRKQRKQMTRVKKTQEAT